MLVENDLYMKSEKYKWKVRKVGLLGVVIELERIKIGEKKGERSVGLTDFQRNQRHTEILGASQLLLVVY